MLLQDTLGAMAPAHIWTVTTLNTRAKELLERGLGTVTVAGEISNYRHDRSGHRYFSLKDAGGVLGAAFFRQRASQLTFEPKDGMQVLAKGVVTVYGPSGRYQMMVTQLQPQGAGALKAAYDALKERLDAEGLFDAARKRPLPLLPRRIAVITSPTGSVWRDIQHVSARRFPHAPLLLVPSRTQGAECIGEVLQALERVAQHHERLGIDVVILARGGGSLEDLWGFNDEAVARRVASFPVPVVSAIGHETDFTIADYVADVRAPTPSAAAEVVVPVRAELQATLSRSWARMGQATAKLLRHERLRLRAPMALLGDGRRSLWAPTQRLAHLDNRISQAMQRALGRTRQRFSALLARLAAQHPRLALNRQRAAQQRAQAAMVHALGRLVQQGRSRLQVHVMSSRLAQAPAAKARGALTLATQRLQALSPLAVLERGYSIIQLPDGRALRRQQDAPPQTSLDVRLHDGSLTVRVEPKV